MLLNPSMSKKNTHWYVNEENITKMERRNDIDGYNNSYNTNKSSSLECLDEPDGWFGDFLSNKTKLSEERLQEKVAKYNLLIEKQLQIKEENVSKYLEDVQRNFDRNQRNKLKLNFEKTNKKCSHHIDYFYRKKDAYLKRLQNHRGSLPNAALNYSPISKRPRNNSSTKVEISNQRSPQTSCASTENVIIHNWHPLVSKHSKIQPSVNHFTNEFISLTTFLVPKCKSAADLSPRVASKEFSIKKHDGDDSDYINNEINNVALEKLNKDSLRDFYLARQKLKDLNGNNNHLVESIKQLQSKLESIHDDGKILLEWQKKRAFLQKDMFELLGRQQQEINCIKKELNIIEEKIEMKIFEKGREMQEAIELCQYQVFQLEHTSSNHNLNFMPDNKISTKSIGQFAIGAVVNLLTLITAIFVVMATTASSIRHYQLNATWLQKFQASILLVIIICVIINMWDPNGLL